MTTSSSPTSTNPTLPSEDDYSYYYSFFQQEIDADQQNPPPTPPPPPPPPPPATDDEMPKKKKPKSSSSKKRAIASLLTSLSALESDHRSDSAGHHLSDLQSNLDHHTQTLLSSYSSHLEEEEDEEDSLLEHSLLLHSSTAAAAAALAAAEDAVEESSSAAAAASASSAAAGGGGQRRLWVKDRSRDWWDQLNHPDFPDSEFKKAFRMGKETFDMICRELESAVAKEDTMLRAAIPVRQRVAVCVWRLATGEPLRIVSKKFGLGISTCHKLVLEVCSAIRAVLMPRFLRWPHATDEEQSRKSRCESISGIPNVVGSMYTTHIPIIAPKISVASYFNRRHTERNQKTSYTITVQGVVDPDGAFTDICVGWPGAMPDEQVLENSALYKRATKGLFKSGNWVVGGPGYPLLDWVLVPYTHQNLTWTQHAFNEKIGEVQRIAREAFGRLKGRWSCLQRRTEVKLQDLPVVLGACCVLHNICEMRGEGMEPEFAYEAVDDEMVAEEGVKSEVAMQMRDGIAHHLLHHGLAGTKFFL